MTAWSQTLNTTVAELAATTPLEAASVLLGLAYSLLAIRRSRWCWVSGGLSAAILIYLALQARLPMQATLQGYYVVMSVYGWWHWSREQVDGSPAVTVWPLRFHLIACLAVAIASAVSARWLATQTQAAWPFLDSLSTWGSLLATWLVARVKLENWLYWIAIDSLLAFLFAAQSLHFVALLCVIYVGVSAVGFVRWLKTYRTALTAS